MADDDILHRTSASGESDLRAERDLGLLDFAVALLRRRFLAGATLLVSLCLGGIMAWSVAGEEVFIYRSSLQVGSQIIQEASQPFESSSTVVAKLRDSIIPVVVDRYRTGHPDADRVFAISARTAGDNELVVIEARGDRGEGEALAELFGQIVQAIEKDHTVTYNSVKEHLEAGLVEARARAACDGGKGAASGGEELSVLRYQVHLANLKNTRLLGPAVQTLHARGTEPGLVMVLFVVLGIAAALFAVMLAEFLAQLRQRNAAAARRP